MPISSNSRRAFWALVGLTAGSAALMAFLILWQAPQVVEGVWLACQDAVSAVGGYLPAAGLVLPLALAALATARLVRSLALQLWNTRLLVQSMHRCLLPAPPELDGVARELGLEGRLLLVEDGNAYTFTQGLLQPRVWLSAGLMALLDEAELRAVLIHERYHVQQRDPLRVLFSRSLAEALFFLPLAASLRDAYLAAKEVEADEAGAEDGTLASALLKLLRCRHTLPAYATLAAIGPLDVTRTRIERLVHQKPGLRFSDVVQVRHVAASVALALVLLVTSYVSTTRAAAPLDGEECGYTTAPVELQETAPINFTPADFAPQP